MKDQRYFAIKSLIEAKKLNGFQEIFGIIPLSVVRSDMNANYSTLRRRVFNADTLTLKDFRLMAELFEVDAGELLHLAINDVKQKAVGKNHTKELKEKGRSR